MADPPPSVGTAADPTAPPPMPNHAPTQAHQGPTVGSSENPPRAAPHEASSVLARDADGIIAEFDATHPSHSFYSSSNVAERKAAKQAGKKVVDQLFEKNRTAVSKSGIRRRLPMSSFLQSVATNVLKEGEGKEEEGGMQVESEGKEGEIHTYVRITTRPKRSKLKVNFFQSQESTLNLNFRWQ